MPIRRKIGLALLMGVSLFTMVMSIMKLTTIHWQGSTDELQYTASLLILWTGMESTCVVIMGCVPSLRGIVKLDFPALSKLGDTLASLLPTRSSTTSKYNTDLERSEIGQSKTGQQYEMKVTAASGDYKGSSKSSEELIIQPGQGGIQRTDEYTVHYKG